MKFSTSNLSHEDNRQAFNINIGRSLAVAHTQRRSAVPTLQDPIRQNISTVLNSLATQCTPAAGAPPSKRAKADGNAKQNRCSFCPAKRDQDLTKMFSDVVHRSHSRFHNFHNFILPVAIFVFFLSVCVAADVDAEVSIGDDNDDGGSYYSDDFATHIDDNDEDDDKI
ncbi:hypothetical protein ElyMa_002143800 [Elysia marginata]|uniref:Uncharacterized protein n=1 Tax=Elysia marginata TaxID=1093978 RepID=A0AAV4FKC5_9GAST|nr:hypothetical protein ElyMa_002143800 [Elysia marginata]